MSYMLEIYFSAVAINTPYGDGVLLLFSWCNSTFRAEIAGLFSHMLTQNGRVKYLQDDAFDVCLSHNKHDIH